MIYLKCILAGMCFLVGSAIVLPLGSLLFFTIVLPRGKGEVVGVDPVSMVKSSPLLWILAALFFLLGSAWEFRRVTSR